MTEKITHVADTFGIKPGAEKFPLMVVLSFTYVCNARCPNCPYNNSDIRTDYKDALHMSEDMFKRIADECGKYNAFMRLSGGGEPMLHPKAVPLMLYAKQQNAKIGLITNGSFFTEDKLTTLLQEHIDVIEFSVDAADEEFYNKVRPGLSWPKLASTVDLAVKLRNSINSKTKIIVSAINQIGADVEKIQNFWASKVDNVQIRKYLTWGYNKDLSGDSVPYLEPKDRIPCPWLFERLNIDSRGDVTICGEDIAFKYKIANIKDVSIEDIWTGKEFSSFRTAHLERCGDKIEICKDCPDWKYRSWKHNYWKLIKK